MPQETISDTNKINEKSKIPQSDRVTDTDINNKTIPHPQNEINTNDQPRKWYRVNRILKQRIRNGKKGIPVRMGRQHVQPIVAIRRRCDPRTQKNILC